MSLFDDDFYSTRVSRRARVTFQARKDASFKRRGLRWTPVKLALTSSVVGAAAAVLLFGLFAGFDRSDRSVSTVAGVTQVGMSGSNDPLEKTITAAAKVRPAVVSIINEQAIPEGAAGGGKSGSDTPNADGGDGSRLEQAALGSGFIFEIVKGKAHILTNNHVIADAAAVKAVMSNGDTRDAKVIGADDITDLAVLEMDARGIDVVAKFGESDDLRAGQWVMAIGNPLGLSDSLSMGIVSKTKRIIPVSLSQDGNYDWEQEVIQIDASINQGNSGGPLIDLDGNVVGINSMKIADYGVEGVGFAIPSHQAVPVIESLLKYGKVKRPYLGVYTMDLGMYLAQAAAAAEDDGVGSAPSDGSSGASGDQPGSGNDGDGGGSADNSGPEAEAPGAGEGDALPPVAGDDDTIIVPRSDLKLPDDVHAGVIVLQAVGPALEAGLALNDVIVKLDNQPISSTLELRKYLYGKKSIGDNIEVTFYRDGKKQTVTFKLTEKTED